MRDIEIERDRERERENGEKDEYICMTNRDIKI